MAKKIRETQTAYAVSNTLSIEAILEQVQEQNAPLVVIQDDRAIAAIVPISDYKHFALWQKTRRSRKKRKTLTWLEKQERLMVKEVAAYTRIKAKLLRTHNGKWIAIFKGKLVDSDDDEQTLIDRVYTKFGDRTMLIRQVTATPRVYHVNSPQLTPR